MKRKEAREETRFLLGVIKAFGDLAAATTAGPEVVMAGLSEVGVVELQKSNGRPRQLGKGNWTKNVGIRSNEESAANKNFPQGKNPKPKRKTKP